MPDAQSPSTQGVCYGNVVNGLKKAGTIDDESPPRTSLSGTSGTSAKSTGSKASRSSRTRFHQPFSKPVNAAKRSATDDSCETDGSFDGLLARFQSSVAQLTHFTNSSTKANRREQLRRTLWGLLRGALVSNFSRNLFTLVDFLLLLHCVELKSRNESHSGPIVAAHGFFLAWLSLQPVCRILLAMKPMLKADALEEDAKPTQHTRISRLKLWEVLDMILLLMSLVGALTEGLWSSYAILPRIVRSIHLLCVEEFGFRALESLRQIVQLVVYAKSSFFYSLIVLVLQTLIFAAFGMELVQVKPDDVNADRISEKFGRDVAELCCDAFSTLLLSVSTLFSLAWGNQWDNVALPLISVRPWTLIFFMLHVLISSVLLIGILYAVLGHTLTKLQAQQVALEDIRLMEDKRAAITRLDELFTALDTNRDGLLTWDEFYHNRQNDPECQRICNKLDIDDDNLHWLWSVLDSDQDGRVDRNQFLDLMWKVQSPETKWTLIQHGHLMNQIHARIEQQYKITEKGFSLLQAQQQEQQQQLLKNLQTMLGGNSSGIYNQVEGRLNPETASADVNKEESEVLERKEAPRPRRESTDQGELELASEHLRGVQADKVAYYNRKEVIDFWGSGAFVDGGLNKEFHMSQSCTACDFFVSHCWNVPEDYYNYFKRNDSLQSYEYKKAMVVHHILAEGKPITVSGDLLQADVCRTSSQGRRGTKEQADDRVSKTILWIDKACIPQSDKEKKDLCVKLLEQFMQLSRGFIVILSWNYFRRLWCVYEWVCYLRLHSLRHLRIFVGCDVFLRSNPQDTLPLYLASIENLSVTALQCHNQSDHEILEEKVFHYYQGETREESFASFERFAKCTAISFLGKQLVRFRARGSPEDQSAWLGPILASAGKMGYRELENAMAMAEPARWFEIVGKDQESFDLIVEFWFQRIVVQYLGVERKKAVRPRYAKHHKADLFESSDSVMRKTVESLFGSSSHGSLSSLLLSTVDVAQVEALPSNETSTKCTDAVDSSSALPSSASSLRRTYTSL